MKTVATSIFTYFLFQITKQKQTGSIIGNCYLIDHIAEDHINTDKTYNMMKYERTLGTVGNRLLGELN